MINQTIGIDISNAVPADESSTPAMAITASQPRSVTDLFSTFM